MRPIIFFLHFYNIFQSNFPHFKFPHFSDNHGQTFWDTYTKMQQLGKPPIPSPFQCCNFAVIFYQKQISRIVYGSYMCVRSSAPINWGTVLLQCLILAMGGRYHTKKPAPPHSSSMRHCRISHTSYTPIENLP